MGWETSLVTSVNYNRKTYDSKYEVESDLEDLKKLIEKYEADLKSLVVMTEPAKFMSKEDLEECSPLEWVTSKYDVIIEELEWLYIDKWKLGLLLEEWDNCHDEKGLAIPIVKESEEADEYGCRDIICAASEQDIVDLWPGKKAFLDGDFVKTIYTQKDES